MTRSRRILTRSGDQFESSGEEWATDRIGNFTAADFVLVDLTADADADQYAFAMDFGGPNPVTKIVIWKNGFISLGNVTQAQIDWVSTHTSQDSIFGFPGRVIAAGVQDLDSVKYTFGRIDFDEPFTDGIPILRITWTDANFNNLQIQLTADDFAIVDARVSDPAADPGQVGFRIGGYTFDGNSEAVADYFFSDGLGGAFVGDETANIFFGTLRDDLLEGLGGNDDLNGRRGADRMFGGAGDDRYVVGEVGDSVFEEVSGGVDRVSSTISFTLPDQVETLTLNGNGAIDGTGNGLANIITGNDAANRINGRGGADTMKGRGGDDIYVVNHSQDRALESLDGGADKVVASVSFTLGGHVEILQLIGTDAINGNGNALANLLVGNGASNRLDGRGGADRMRGGGGNDIYFVDNGLDRVIEESGDGTDRVSSSVTFKLGDHVERLFLTGADEINATGNDLANVLRGNNAANRIAGGAGNDDLTGKSGADRFVFDTALHRTQNVDDILDFASGADRIFLDRDIFDAITINGVLRPSAFREGIAAQDSNDRILHDSATGRIFYDADGTGAAAAVLFARVDPGLVLANSDFAVFGG